MGLRHINMHVRGYLSGTSIPVLFAKAVGRLSTLCSDDIQGGDDGTADALWL